jgi:hypothetical protein
MNLLFPIVRWKYIPAIIGISLLGALVGGIYGVLHDQITYSISEEYFTKLKFHQFHYANFGFPVRIFVGEVGFLATWWVGMFSAWFLARIAIPAWPLRIALKNCLIGFCIIFGFAIIAGITGWCLGLRHSSDYSNWEELSALLGVTKVPAFVRVAYIHNASYIGGLVGLIIAVIFLLRERSRTGKPIRFQLKANG